MKITVSTAAALLCLIGSAQAQTFDGRYRVVQDPACQQKKDKSVYCAFKIASNSAEDITGDNFSSSNYVITTAEGQEISAAAIQVAKSSFCFCTFAPRIKPGLVYTVNLYFRTSDRLDDIPYFDINTAAPKRWKNVRLTQVN